LSDRVLASVIRLTRERDSDALAASVLETILELTPTRFVALYETCIEAPGTFELMLEVRIGDASERIWKREPQAYARDENLSNVLESSESSSQVSGRGARHLFPVVVSGRCIGVLDVRSEMELGEAARALIRGFLVVYGNFMALLDESSRDKLTGLLNRRTFDEKLARLLRAQRERKPPTPEGVSFAKRREPGPETRAWLGILDLDHFKQINDKFGHAYGDEVLITVARKLQETFRKSDLLFRFGGEEFVVILGPIPSDMAFLVFERFRMALEAHLFHELGTVTTSIGFAAIGDQDYPQVVLERADRALYFAKDSGRNRTCQYEALIARGELSEIRTSGSIDLF